MDRKRMRNEIIAAVVAGVILDALGGMLSIARPMVRWLWVALSTAITMPVWSLVFLLVAPTVVLIAAALITRRHTTRNQNNVGSSGPDDDAARHHWMWLSVAPFRPSESFMFTPEPSDSLSSEQVHEMFIWLDDLRDSS
jgi:hypothetical protein